jgi:hypothetical protein
MEYVDICLAFPPDGAPLDDQDFDQLARFHVNNLDTLLKKYSKEIIENGAQLLEVGGPWSSSRMSIWCCF